ncbi:uncharacterized protein DNG_01998 [Cephalotrichum gorgonifer]|uniref:DUF676 domain-containing protein n=1 Tax=Cephalotrichum gorgonifer TaxID=2041049 RepID=A0AAE8MS86_9PEZI|nr:uncharacterized protein DNG_01998 [Cephalotrichum gorgonifer]
MAEMLSNSGPPQAPSSSTESGGHAYGTGSSTSSQGKSTQGEPKGSFVKIDGSVGGSGYDETTVDVIAVPCPSADPLETWSRDALVENYFGAPSMRSSTRTSDLRESQTSGATGGSGGTHGAGGTVTSGSSRTTPPSWVRLGIRREASKARVLMYDHREVVEGTTLNVLAEDLLREILGIRLMQDRSRPIFFISHSVGGLVVKLALAKASRNPLYESILNDCYGAVFFATPHRGSNYLSMPEISPSIQTLLELSRPLPLSITDDLRVGHPFLLHLEEEFRFLSCDLQVWTFYETIESRLSGEAQSRPGEVYFTAPITPPKSAILGIRQETIYPLQSDHANCASFGKNNAQTMKLFLKHLARSIARADRSGKDRTHTPMNLDEKVPVEVHGFYEDTVAVTSAETLTTIRTWSTRVSLKDYLAKGPVECIDDRLNEVNDGPVDNQFMAARRRTSRLREENLPSPPPLELGTNLLGIGAVGHAGRRANSEIALPKSGSDEAALMRVGSTAPPAAPSSVPDPAETAGWEGRQSGFDAVRSRSTSATRPPRTTEESSAVESPRSRRRVALTRRFTDQFNPRWSGPLEKSFFQGPPFVPGSPFDTGGQIPDGADPYVPVFVKPDPSNRRYIWTHLPFTNPAWVKKTFETLEVKEGRSLSEVYNHGQWYSKHTRGRHSQHYAYFVKPTCGWIPPAPRSPLTPHSSHVASHEPIIYLFIPFLHFDSYKNLLRRRSLINRRLRQGRARPVPQNVARLQSLELQVIWEYLGYDPPVNCRRTLDQYGYPSLHDTRPRDDDQMLYKMTKERIPLSDQVGVDSYDNPPRRTQKTRRETSSVGSKDHADDCECSDEEPTVNEDDVLNGNVLMVDQLWMWAVGPNTLLTFFSRRESDPAEGPLYQQGDLRDSIFNDVNSDVTRQCESALDMAALIALHAVTVLLDRTSHPDLEVFRIFEEAISILTEKMTSSLKEFRTRHLRPPPTHIRPDPKPHSSHTHHTRHEADIAAHENRDSTSALLELRDIEDELATLSSLFDKQERMLGTMRNLYRRVPHTPTETGISYIAEALARLGEYKERTREMTRRVRATRDDYDKLLQMVQRQAQVDEVRLQRLQADVASSQSRSVMIFTVFTVIFLPLSFFTSLFGMNAREWDDEHVPRLRTIWLVTLPSSAFLIGLALVTAWSTRVRTFLVALVSLHRRTTAVLAEGVEAVGSMMPSRRAAENRRAREEGAKRRASERKRRRKLAKEGSAGSADFWERHRLEREHAYKIPAANRKRDRQA